MAILRSPSPSAAYEHRGSDLQLLGATLDAHLREVVARFPEREAVVSIPQGARVSYAELDERVQRLAAGLVASGVERGDRVGIWSTDNVEWVLVQCAAARIGAVLVNVNPAYKASELEYALRLAGVQTLFLIPSFRDSDYLGMVRELCSEARRGGSDSFACERLPDLRRVVVIAAEPQADRRGLRGFRTWAQLVDAGRAVSARAIAERGRTVDPDDPANIQFTSGTTGAPKAVVLTHHNLLNNAWFAAHAMGFTERDRLCVPVPFYHCFGMVVSNLVCLTQGAAIVIPAPHFEPGATLRAIQDERCTAVHGVPTMFTAELECAEREHYDLSSLRTGIMAGAPCPPELVRRVVRELGCRELMIGYGQTEASPITHLTERSGPVEERAASVGRNLPHQEVKVVDPHTGRILERGEVGEVCFRGYHVMRGYHGDEEATKKAIDEASWLHSGDLGSMRPDGSLCITGRLKDMVIRGGENLYPAEIEALLREHPAVREAAVFGVPDELMGEELGAWVRLHEGVEVAPRDLREFVSRRAAHFKAPRYVWLVSDFPMTVTGKVQKFRIREEVERWLAARDARARGADLAPRARIPSGSEP